VERGLSIRIYTFTRTAKPSDIVMVRSRQLDSAS
jgi:hypothetical protein